MNRRWSKILFIAVIALLTMFEYAGACPNCFSNSNPHVLKTYYASVLFLTLLPISMVVGVVGWLIHQNRKTQNNNN